jgi:hypothetical protein
MSEETKLALLEVLLPVAVEVAVLEILEAMHSAESMTATEVLQLLAAQQARKTVAMANYNALVAKIKAGG